MPRRCDHAAQDLSDVGNAAQDSAQVFADFLAPVVRDPRYYGKMTVTAHVEAGRVTRYTLTEERSVKPADA